jgi:hypothetical protein
MQKARIATCALLLLLSMVLSPIAINPVNAARSGWDEGTYGAAGVIHASDIGSPPNNTEITWVQWACNDIFNWAFAPQRLYVYVYFPPYYYGWWDYGHAYSYMYNYMVNYESSTSYNNVIADVDRGESHSYYPFATLLYIGHNAYEQRAGIWHYGFLGHGKGLPSNSPSIDKIWDDTIYNHINNLRYRFVFLWVCRNGNERGDYHSYPQTPNGMPYCWTHGQVTSNFGYTAPDGSGYCVISFENMSPMICEPLDRPSFIYGYNTNRHKNWLVFFYYALIEYGYSVHDAMYQASVWSGYPGGFTQTKLYKGALQYYCGEESIGFPAGWYWSKMRIYGDGNMHVPGDIYVYP